MIDPYTTIEVKLPIDENPFDKSLKDVKRLPLDPLEIMAYHADFPHTKIRETDDILEIYHRQRRDSEIANTVGSNIEEFIWSNNHKNSTRYEHMVTADNTMIAKHIREFYKSMALSMKILNIELTSFQTKLIEEYMFKEDQQDVDPSEIKVLCSVHKAYQIDMELTRWLRDRPIGIEEIEKNIFPIRKKCRDGLPVTIVGAYRPFDKDWHVSLLCKTEDNLPIIVDVENSNIISFFINLIDKGMNKIMIKGSGIQVKRRLVNKYCYMTQNCDIHQIQ